MAPRSDETVQQLSLYLTKPSIKMQQLIKLIAIHTDWLIMIYSALSQWQWQPVAECLMNRANRQRLSSMNTSNDAQFHDNYFNFLLISAVWPVSLGNDDQRIAIFWGTLTLECRVLWMAKNWCGALIPPLLTSISVLLNIQFVHLGHHLHATHPNIFAISTIRQLQPVRLLSFVLAHSLFTSSLRCAFVLATIPIMQIMKTEVKRFLEYFLVQFLQ